MAKVDSMPSVEYLRECFELTECGRLFWKARPRRHFSTDRGWRSHLARDVGKSAGTKDGKGYLVITFGGRRIYVHRIVFAMTHGRWASKEVDHADGNRSNNAPSNLREAEPWQQRANTCRPSHNTSGFKGVSRHKNRWRSYIVIGRKQKHLGLFLTPEAAAEAYKKAAQELFGEFARP